MARNLKLDTKLDSEFSQALQNAYGDTIRKPVRMFLGNPSEENQLYFDSAQTKVWICDDPNEPNRVTSMPKAGIPPAKLMVGTAVLCTRTKNGYRFADIDWDYDEQFSEDDSQQIDQKPILVSQLSYGTIQPFSGMSVTIKGAFYGDTWKPDFVTGDIDDQVDTSLANINKPTTNNRAIGILVQFNEDTETFTYKQSAQYPANISLEQQVIAGNLPLPDDNCHRVGYIQLYNAQNSIIQGDIFQAPDWISAIGLRASGSVTDEAIARWDGATGKLLQDSFVFIDDNGNMSGVETLNFNSAVGLTIASGAVTVTTTYNRIDTQGAASTDDLDTINWALGTTAFIFIRAENAARTVVVKHGTGNIETPTGTDISLDETYKILLLLYDNNASVWKVVGGAGSGGSGGAPDDATYILQVADGDLPNAQALGALASGIMKSTTTTGVVSTVAAPSGAVVGDTDAQTLTNKTLTTPTIADFTNAQHDHTDADDGGQLTDAALSSPVGISKGGTGQTAIPAAFDALAPTTTKGDLIVHDGTDNVRVPVGANGTHLRANSADSEGVDYNYGLELIDSGQLGSAQATISFSSIPAHYQDLILKLHLRGTQTGATGISVNMTFNTDTGTNYSKNQTVNDNTAAATNAASNNATAILMGSVMPNGSATSGFFGHLMIEIGAYTDSAITRGGHWYSTLFQTVTNLQRSQGTFGWENLASAITSIELNPDAGNFEAGTTYSLYGRGGAI